MSMMSSPTMAAPPSQPFSLDEKGMRTAREAREAARAAKNGSNYHARRTYSPPADDFHGAEGDAPRSPISDIALQDAMLARAESQQRVVPIGQSNRNSVQRRPPVANVPVSRAGGGGPGGAGTVGGPQRAPQSPKSLPPSYSSGVQLEDGPQSYDNPTRRGHYRRNTGPSAGGRGASGSDPALSTQSQGPPPPGSTMNPQNRRPRSMADDMQQRRPFSSNDLSQSAASINRLNSPSIGKSVLQPLEQKMMEYNHLMDEAQKEMIQLDEELRNLQERRRQAEDRFNEAKTKHDEYHRQHVDVGRALRGDLERARTPRPMPRMESVMSFDPPQRAMSEQSTKSHGRVRARDRLRMSLFKG